MKKLVILIVLSVLTLTTCKKEPIMPVRFGGTWISNSLHLPDFEASKMILEIEEDLQNIEVSLTAPISIIKVDSSFYKKAENNFVVHFSFINIKNQYGNIEIFKSDSKMYNLIGYINIRTDNCGVDCEYDQKENAYFNRKK